MTTLKLLKQTTLGLIFTALAATPLMANDNNLPNHEITEWKIGKTVSGEKRKLDELKGKVVVIENWGVHCGPCIAMIPHLAELDKKYRDKGLVIIGVERQGSSEDAIKQLLKENKAEYTVTSGGSGPIATRSIPHAFVFDVNGKLIFNGHPGAGNFDATIKSALKEVTEEASAENSSNSGPLFASRTWTNSEGKTLKAAALSLEGDKVKFRMPNSSIVLYELSKLSEEDQKLIKEKAGQSE
ncbi:thiol-disulfide oxidoreductase ResA [Rubritalea halochordaticola]|uniref:Thiol-disulfide oxidoreductase ResA n=1 Tax=Rubritalea halochordaticola TaxID=714537 RepID=A0ABP9UZG0_9BACT